ncbi:AraC family transcriptional regulator [Clostridium sp. E02]|uniref:AraC family transcriptional regulator n=1 Tax=Clostridium sp. E02 TaxID=2487134 RepID=UPI000F53644C|nr:AraC family transcriptional regulator [Clostridium sp. E02]
MNELLLQFLKDSSSASNGLIRHLTSEKDFLNLVIEGGRLMNLYCQPAYTALPNHRHNYVELVYMYSGESVHTINSTRKIKLETNDLLLLRQGTNHAMEPPGENDLAVHFLLLPEFFTHPALMTEDGSVLRHFIAGAAVCNNSVADYLHFHLKDILPAQNLLENMIWSLMTKKRNRQEINQATMGILIMELLEDADNVEFHHLAQYEEQIALKAFQYLENYYPSATLEEFSIMTMHPSYYISRLFKRYFQMTFTECLKMIRLSRAANYLMSTAKPVEQIILEIGYENSSYFHRLFKERYGLTPKQYRDRGKD